MAPRSRGVVGLRRRRNGFAPVVAGDIDHSDWTGCLCGLPSGVGVLPSSATTVLTLLASSAGLNPRPQLVGFLLFAITVLAWREMVRDQRPRWWLVPLFWLWACSHGLWTFGLAVSALTLAGMFMTPGST